MTKLITKEIAATFAKNHKLIESGTDRFTLPPVVKFFTPDAAATWLIVEGYEQGSDLILWGWCDLGLGFPEFGQVTLQELQSIRGKLGLPVERDLYFDSSVQIGDLANT